MLFSLALPLIGPLMGSSAPQVAALKDNFVKGFLLNEITITPDGVQPMTTPEIVLETASRPHFTLWQVFAGIYLIGVGVMTLLFLFKLGKLVVLIIRSPKRKMSSCIAVFTGREQGSFSFFRYAFFPNENVDPDIMRHEMSHIAHHHSWDILFAEVMMILQWFNPFIYLYKKELQSLHEYQADRDVVATGVDKKNYMMLILQQCTAVDFSGMSNNFSLILTKKRIKMITKNEKAKGLWWRLLATLPVLAVLMIANTKVTAQEQQPEKKQINVEIGQFEIFDDNGFPMDLTDTIIYNEDGSYVHFKTTEAPDPMTGEMRSKITATSCNADGTPNENIKFTINAIEKHGDTTMYTVEPFTLDADNFRLSIQTTEDNPVQIIRNNNDSIYQIVEEMPQFPGGEKAMMEYVAKNVKYPQEAKDKEIQGRVFVGFVVEKDGSVSTVKVLRGIGGGCDEEAVRVVSSMPKWKPGIKDGKPVRVSYMMPLNFKLTEGQPAKPSKKADANKPDMKPDKDGVYQIAEEMPRFLGDDKALMVYLQKNLIMPEKYKGNTDENPSLAEYRTFVKFVVNEDGSISDIQLLRKSAEFKDLDEEAIRVVKSMPNWEPGKIEGKPVKVYFNLPIVFKFK
jgi:TonB family protein